MDFFVDVFALRGARRADNDEELRSFERGNGLIGKRLPSRKALAVAEDRAKRFRHPTDDRLAARQILANAVAFQCCVAPRLVAMAVAQEGAIFKWDGLAHRISRTI